MGIKLSKKNTSNLINFPKTQDIIDFVKSYKKNKNELKLGHPILDYFQKHYFEMMQFCRIQNIPENELWDIVRNYGNQTNCQCNKCYSKDF